MIEDIRIYPLSKGVLLAWLSDYAERTSAILMYHCEYSASGRRAWRPSMADVRWLHLYLETIDDPDLLVPYLWGTGRIPPVPGQVCCSFVSLGEQSVQLVLHYDRAYEKEAISLLHALGSLAHSGSGEATEPDPTKRGPNAGTLERVREAHQLAKGGMAYTTACKRAGIDSRSYQRWCERATGELPIGPYEKT